MITNEMTDLINSISIYIEKNPDLYKMKSIEVYNHWALNTNTLIEDDNIVLELLKKISEILSINKELLLEAINS